AGRVEGYRRWTVSHHLPAQPNSLKNPCYSPRMRYPSTEPLGLSSRLYLYEEANRSNNGKEKVKNCVPHEHQICWRLSHAAIPISYRFYSPDPGSGNRKSSEVIGSHLKGV